MSNKMWAILGMMIYSVIIVNANMQQWNEFKIKHGKTYVTPAEEVRRYDIFKSNLKSIEEHNAKYEKGEATWYQAVNHMSDWTDEEFNQLVGVLPYEHIKNENYHIPSGVRVPSSIDWRDKGVVNEVQQQGSCGSCWTFTVAGTIEGMYGIKTGKLVKLSEQNLLDCATIENGYYCFGCTGGIPESALQYVQDNGIAYYDDYPYEGEVNTCRNKSSVLNISGYTSVADNNETDLLDAVGNVGPVAVAINHYLIKNYAGGIFQDQDCSKSVTHGVLAIGYGSENETDYWLIKNSWGTTWGISGYMKMIRGQNMCGIASQACYANI
ncbi:procathepsin L-like [Anthonomus grandis grandis]|uniref:procathepsin L-like n=1 Tax=Anthonomus grandis grandis TaxID=2921223 RepID=UPI0021654A7C|nr:procathepsin L-like [Anthonomus grandis grandis]